jgi:acylpyruvate hydrolase
MRLTMFSAASAPRLGAVVGDLVIDLSAAHAAFRATTGDDCVSQPLVRALVPEDSLEFLRGGHRSREAAAETLAWLAALPDGGASAVGPWGELLAHALDAVQLLSPILHPRKIVCVGLNYRDHAEEQGIRPEKLPRNPIIFAKYDRSLVGHGQDVEHPAVTDQLDYEAELAVVIGKAGRFIAPEDVFDHIAGYACFNDVTSRDVQLKDRQWLRGKMGDTHAPFGPWIVTRDEIADPDALPIRLSVNGETVQDSNTEQAIFKVAEIVSFLSRSVTFDVGDVIATGTPAGVGFVRTPPLYMNPGDEVEMEIEGIGALRNRIVAAVGA